MKKREPVSHIMTKNVFTIDLNDNLIEVKNLLNKRNIRHVPVLQGDKLVGILSSSDMNRLTFGHFFEKQEDADEAILQMLSVGQVMKANPQSIESSSSIKEAAEILVKADFHALPVVENEKLVGILTTTDVIKYMLDNY